LNNESYFQLVNVKPMLSLFIKLIRHLIKKKKGKKKGEFENRVYKAITSSLFPLLLLSYFFLLRGSDSVAYPSILQYSSTHTRTVYINVNK
jgi:hypothetical protein